MLWLLQKKTPKKTQKNPQTQNLQPRHVVIPVTLHLPDNSEVCAMHSAIFRVCHHFR